jgi:diguanylate cyclase (GGDEF)-like protein
MAGDEVLRQLVKLMTAQLRRNDVIARYGGEELVVILLDTQLQDGLLFAERLRAKIAASPISFDEHAITVTISIGAAAGDGRDPIDEILRKADRALYTAKNAGRNRVVSAGDASPDLS